MVVWPVNKVGLTSHRALHGAVQGKHILFLNHRLMTSAFVFPRTLINPWTNNICPWINRILYIADQEKLLVRGIHYVQMRKDSDEK